MTEEPSDQHPFGKQVRVQNLDGAIGSRIPEWMALPKVTDNVERGVYLANVVRVDDEGELNPQGVDAFIDRVRAACKTGYMQSRWAPIISIPLARKGDYERALLAAYFESAKSREELNALLGETFNGVQPIFVEEGGLGPEL